MIRHLHYAIVCLALSVSTASAQSGADDLKAFGIPATPKSDRPLTDAKAAATGLAKEAELVYDGDPVDIVLGVGNTARIVFDFVAHIGVPADMADRLDIKTLPSGIFVTATAPFEANVVQVRNADDTRVIPLYLSAIGSADPAYTRLVNRVTVVDATIAPPPSPPVMAKTPDPVVVTPPAPTPAPQPVAPAAPAATPLKQKVADVIPRAGRRTNAGLIEFIRMLAQHHHGPARLVASLGGVETLAVDDTQSVRLIPGARVVTTPVASFSYRNYIGTAIAVSNPGDTEYAIDPRTFIGHWRYAAVVDRASVIPPGEQVTVFLISDRPFKQALRSVVWGATR